MNLISSQLSTGNSAIHNTRDYFATILIKSNYTLPKNKTIKTYATINRASKYLLQAIPFGSGNFSSLSVNITNINTQYELNLKVQ